MGTATPNPLAEFLRTARDAKGLTLRAVDEKTGVSNAYLSQVECGKIRQPSPAILYRLCDLYGVSYTEALLLAGHPVPGVGDIDPLALQRLARFGSMTEDEEAALAAYLRYLRRGPPGRTRQ
jgi:transcriptional regulator with XRE-family HTH domain